MFENGEQAEQQNISRFLIQQLNLDEQPTQEQVLERAQQLEIDDLLLARESLIRQMDPEWRPYCNRHSEIYYVNLLERLAYVDHPIDMYFKKQYAKSNGLPVPRFRTYKLEKISKSLGLIEEEIRNYQARTHRQTLKIVYEQPSQEEALSSHPKTPANYAYNQSDNPSPFLEEQLTLEQLEQLYSYQRQLQEQFQQKYTKHKKQKKQKLKALEEDHHKTINYIIQQKIEDICDHYEEELTRKNRAYLDKQIQKLEAQCSIKKTHYADTIAKFYQGFQKLRQKQRNVEVLEEEKNTAVKIQLVQSLTQRAQFEKMKALQSTKTQILKQFNQDLACLQASSTTYQQQLKNSLHLLYQSTQYQSKQQQPAQTIIESGLAPSKVGTYERRKIFGQGRSLAMDRKILETNISYEELKKEIQGVSVWDQDGITVGERVECGRDKASLNLRLRMRIL